MGEEKRVYNPATGKSYRVSEGTGKSRPIKSLWRKPRTPKERPR